MPTLKKKRIPKYLTTFELTQFFSVIENFKDRLIFMLIYYHGLRVSELCNLNIVDMKQGADKEWYIYIEALKNGECFDHALAHQLIQPLTAYLAVRKRYNHPSGALFISQKNNRFSRWAVEQKYIKYARMASIPREKCSVHKLRHSIAVHLYSSGAESLDVKKHLRHQSFRSTEIYLNVMNEARLKKQRKLFHGEYVVNV